MKITATRWTLIGAARGGDAAAQSAFVAKYRAPVLGFLRRAGAGEETEDLTQEVFLRMFTSGLDRADAAKGRFRHLLLAVARHVLTDHWRRAGAVKRGGRAEVHPLGDHDPPAQEADDVFEREWMSNLLGLAMDRLEREHPTYHEAIRLSLLDHDRASVARAMRRSGPAVRNYLHRGKQKLISYVRESVWEYTASQEECSAELADLGTLLGQRALGTGS